MMLYLKRMIHNKQFMLLLFLCAVMVTASFMAENFAPNDPYELHYDHILKPESWNYPMGTDHMGRCVFSRLLYGGRGSLLTVFAIVAITATIGTSVGIFSAMVGGAVDMVIMRIVDLLMAFPGMVLTIAIVSFLGVGVFNIFLALTVTGWIDYARVSRAMTLSILNNEYIQEAKLGGAGFIKLMTHYIFPNIFAYILVMMTQDLGSSLLTLATLSLLGLGAQPPQPEWGFMLSEGKPFMQKAPWLLFYPGSVILINVILFNLLGDSLRDILDPRYRKKERKFVRMKKRNVFLSVMLILFMMLTACSAKNQETSEGGDDSSSEQVPKHLTAAVSWFGEDLDPANGWNAWTLSRAGIGENLATVNENMEIVPQLSDEWEVVDDTTWKFHIRQGVKFSNGKDLTPQDVKKSIERAIAKDERAKNNAKMESIEVDGEYVIFKTTGPYGSLLANLTEPLFTIIDTEQSEDDIAKGPISTGPYAVTSFTPDVEIQLVANEHYWNGKPGLDTLMVRNIADDDTRLLEVQSGEVHMAQRMGATGISVLQEDANFQVIEVPSLRVLYLCLNHENEFLKDIHLRKAMSFALDRDKLASIQRGEPAGAVFPKIAGYGYDKIDLQTHNMEMAKKELEEGGYKDTDGDGILEKDGKKVSFELPIPKSDPLAEAVQSQLKEIGVEIRITLMENITEARESQSFDLLLLNYVTATTGDSKRFMEQNYATTGTDNFGHYKNQEFDKLVDSLTAEFDPQKRIEITTKGQQILNEDVANIYLITIKNNTVAAKNVKNITVFPIDYYFITKDVTVE